MGVTEFPVFFVGMSTDNIVCIKLVILKCGWPHIHLSKVYLNIFAV